MEAIRAEITGFDIAKAVFAEEHDAPKACEEAEAIIAGGVDVAVAGDAIGEVWLVSGDLWGRFLGRDDRIRH